MNEKCTALFYLLCEQSRPMSIAALASVLGLKARTIRYNLDKLDAFLKENGCEALIRKTNKGISCDISPKQFELLRKKLDVVSVQQYTASQPERVDMIAANLLCAADYVTIDTLAAQFDVSRTTVVKDLRVLRAQMKEWNIVLFSQTRHGLRLLGEEKHLRRLAVQIFKRNAYADSNVLRQIAPALNRVHKLPLGEFEQLFHDIDIQYIEICIAEAEQQLEIVFSDEAFCALTLHIIIAIQRMRCGGEIMMAPDDLEGCKLTPEFAAAAGIAGKIENRFAVQVPVDEIGYIAIHLLGSNLQTAVPTQWRSGVALQLMAAKLLREVARRLAHKEIASDEYLFQGLLAHLKPALYRLKNDMHILNPVLTEIKQNLTELFYVVKESLASVEKTMGGRFDDAEVGYFTLHFGAVLARYQPGQVNKVKVLVVCSTGAGTAQILSSRLQKVFQVQIVDIVAWRQAKEVLKEKSVDFVITTLPVQLEDVHCIQVNPLLLDKDIAKLKLYLPVYESSAIISLDQVMAVVEQHCDIKNRKELELSLAAILQMNEQKNVKRGDDYPLLSDLLNKNTMLIGGKASGWEEAVRLGGQVMLENGMIEARYIDAMVNTVKELGAYIVIAPGIAMPHARPEDGAKQVGSVLVTLKEPVCFGNIENDPVHVLVFLCAVDKVAHLNALADLMQLFEDETFLEVAARAETEEVLLNYILNLEKGDHKDA